MRGGSQAHLMRASDGNYYVVKFQNCPQHPKVLANEFLATKLGLALGLPMPEVRVIEVSDHLISSTPELRIEIEGRCFPCSTGLQLGSRYAGDIWQDYVTDYVPESLFERVVNRMGLIQALAFDKWVGNCDRRQAVFSKPRSEPFYRMTCIDQGHCFNAQEWNFPDLPIHGAYNRRSVYQRVMGWESFEPVLSQIEQFDSSLLWACALNIPDEWHQECIALYYLIETLLKRRLLTRKLITNFRNCPQNPFPNWSAQ
jgi:HipA-like protein